MPIDILVGLQYGDEGKGRVVDSLAPNYKCVARFNGGNNAGHTVKFSPEGSRLNKTLKLHSLPSGIAHEGVYNFIGRGCVVNPLDLMEEIQTVQGQLDRVFNYESLGISPYAHVIHPKHIRLDEAANGHIGTTGKGIGPAFSDKHARTGQRLLDLPHLGSLTPFTLGGADDEFSGFVEDDAPILCEGAQGTFLDIDHGEYPYVTSSNTVASHACTTLGFGPGMVRDVIGVFKAYSTRVGEGTLQGEWTDPDTFTNIRKVEVGTTTGRQRRIGPLNLVQLRKACRLNGVTKLIMTKADLLTYSTFDVIVWGGKMQSFGPWEECAPSDEKFMDFIRYIEEFIGVKIEAVSVGPRREQWAYNNLTQGLTTGV